MQGDPKRAWVLSDIHLGPGNELTSFRDHAALAAFVGALADDPEPCELILAGDVFDFLQCEGYAGFEVEQAPEYMRTILRERSNAPVVSALTHFAARPDCRMTLLAGNHDPELLLPEVRAEFESALRVPTGRILYPDDEAQLLPGNALRPALTGRVLRVGDAEVWVVHGDRWDPHNAIDRRRVMRLVRTGAHVELPPGSHLVFEVLQKLKPERPWIDLLKPEVPTTVLLLLYLAPRETAELLRRHHGLSGRLLVGMIRARAAVLAQLGEGDEDHQPSSELLPECLSNALAAGLGDESPDLLLTDLVQLLDEQPRPVPAGGLLAEHAGLSRWLIRSWLALLRQADRFQDVTAPDPVSEAVTGLPPQVSDLVAGHTHGLRAHPGGRPRYWNSGTWVPVGAVPGGALEAVIDQLEKGDLTTAEAPRTVVEIDWRDGPARLALMRCDDRGRPEPVAS